MMKQLPHLALIIILATITACTGQPVLPAIPTPLPTASPVSPTATVTATLSPSPTFAPTATPTVTPTVTPTPTVSLAVTVWRSDPRLPVVLYHQFKPDDVDASTAMKLRLADFRTHLQAFYDAGFVLVNLEDWLAGDMSLPPGKRPLALSMDDLFFNNQIGLDENGIPKPTTGLGVLWQFSQEHPDFGFRIALFTNLGDKLFDNPDHPDWEAKLAQTIAWCMDHDARVYNHLYAHPQLDLSTPSQIKEQLVKNDLYLRELLEKAGRPDLAARLGNMIALPYSIWPATQAGKEVLFNYLDPEGKPVAAIFEADYIYRPSFVLPPYDPAFDRFKLPRMNGTQSAVDYLTANLDLFPLAEACLLAGLDPAQQTDPAYLAEAARQAVESGQCQAGVYGLPGGLVQVTADQADLLALTP